MNTRKIVLTSVGKIRAIGDGIGRTIMMATNASVTMERSVRL